MRRTPNEPFLGLFAPVNMDLEWTGPLAAPYPGPAPTACTTLEPGPTGDRAAPGGHDDEGDRPARARRAGTAGKGFFLQVEGASIDKQDHAVEPVRSDR